MAKNEEKKDYAKLKATAESLFVTSGMTAREIAEVLKLPEVTISRWRNSAGEQSWDEKKEFIKTTPARLRETLLREAERVANGEVSNVKADVLVKLLSGADKLAAKATPDVVYSVLTECCQYISSLDAAFAIKMAEYHRLFLQYKISQSNGK